MSYNYNYVQIMPAKYSVVWCTIIYSTSLHLLNIYIVSIFSHYYKECYSHPRIYIFVY